MSAELDEPTVRARLELLAKLSREAPLAPGGVDMSAQAIRERLMELAEVSAVCFALSGAGERLRPRPRDPAQRRPWPAPRGSRGG